MGETRQQDDPRPTAELIRLALAERDADARWRCVLPIHWRHNRDSFEQATALCRAESARERVLGADIIAQFGIGRDVFHDEHVDLLLDLLNDPRPTVLAAAATAFGHLKAVRSVEPLAALRTHPSKRVRWGVTFGLLGHEDDSAIAALIALSRDPVTHIRDWATFGLGRLVDLDTPELRAALLDRLDDTDKTTASEAISGLASRGDRRAFAPLMAALETGANSDPYL